VKRPRSNFLGFDTLQLEGALLLPDVLEKAAQGKANRQNAEDYHVPRGFTVQEEIGRAFRIAQAQWKAFSAGFERTDLDSAVASRAFAEEFLCDALGYREFRNSAPVAVGDRRFPVTAFAAPGIPVVIAPQELDLDDPATVFALHGGGARKKSPFQLLQEFLNADPDCRWGIATNGRRVRLARDAATLTRPSFIEFDLEAILGQARYPDFAALWRLLHASRAVRVGESIWESWRNDGQHEGSRVREGLRIGVEAALKSLGEGFLKHPANEPLRRALITGELTRKAYFEELLRLVYRFIFLFAVEERGLLHSVDDSARAGTARKIYEEGYSARRLRERCLRRAAREAYDDLWQAQVIVFRALAVGEPRLALPALGGLFAPEQCAHLDAASLANRALLEAMHHLRWSSTNGTVAPVDYRNMGPEELGSVYESLLELVPDTDAHARTFGFIRADADGETRGNARKTSGSYYTPDSLVQELIKSALDPLIEARLAAQPDRPIEALLAITVVDPACGSGHFLLAAARRLAERLAALRAPEGAVRAQDYRHALRDVITHCVYGVDRNPMALELARFAFWLEGFEQDRPLGFLDHHLVCGDALIGITDIGQLMHGIPDTAFKALSGDDKAVCKALAKENKEGLKAFAKRKADPNISLTLERDDLLAERTLLEAMADDTLERQAAKQAAYEHYATRERNSRLKQAADLFVGAFLAPKATSHAVDHTPTSQNLYLALFTESAPEDLPQAKQIERIARATELGKEARVLHWPLAFVQVFQKGGFDCVLGNPPWERIKLQEEEFFAVENRLVAEARNKAERAQRIEWLAEGMLAQHLYPDMEHRPDEAEREKETYARFITARRFAEAASVFAHLEPEEGGRFPLTGVGDINTYALFAETINQLIGERGHAGFIVPTGIATDDSTKGYFEVVTQSKRLISLLGFENEEFVFPDVHHSFRFCLLTLGFSEQADFVFFARQPHHIHDRRRRFSLTPSDLRMINPNTRTCPTFRSEKDAQLTKRLYQAHPILVKEGEEQGNPWDIEFLTMFHMSGDSHLFHQEPDESRLPLYEAKMIEQYDHRAGSYERRQGDRGFRVLPPTPLEAYRNPLYVVRPFYWVARSEVRSRLASKWEKEWFIGFKDITSAVAYRTFISTILPYCGVGHTMPLILPSTTSPRAVACLLANINSLVVDYVARQKIGYVHMTYGYVRQLPVVRPDRYVEADYSFVVPRVLELTYTSSDLNAWAKFLDFGGQPFEFDPDRRACLRAELDAYYARLYALTREDLCYILNPASVVGDDYPSETFRVLKQTEEREFGEYRTQRLVLAAWDTLERGELV
jgi:hypothetical protein